MFTQPLYPIPLISPLPPNSYTPILPLHPLRIPLRTHRKLLLPYHYPSLPLPTLICTPSYFSNTLPFPYSFLSYPYIICYPLVPPLPYPLSTHPIKLPSLLILRESLLPIHPLPFRSPSSANPCPITLLPRFILHLPHLLTPSPFTFLHSIHCKHSTNRPNNANLSVLSVWTCLNAIRRSFCNGLYNCTPEMKEQ